MHLPKVAALFTVLVACNRSQSIEVRDQPVVAASSAPSAVLGGHAATASGEASAAPAPIGMTEPAPASAAATKENDAAVRLLAKGTIEPALAGFEKALALSPSFVLARYNLACARARAGDFDGAERELGTVFENDWIGLRVQAGKDQDLASFRSSPQGKRLFATEATLERRYAASLARGVRALYWLAKSKDDIQAEGIRLGVWDPTTARFVATSERRKGTLSGYVSDDLAYGVLLTGSIPMLAGDMADHVAIKDVSFWSFDPGGAPLGTMNVGKGAFSGALDFEGDATGLQMRSALGYDNPSSPKVFELRTTFAPSTGTSKPIFAAKLPVRKPDPAKGRGALGLPFHNGFETWSASAGYTFDDEKRLLTLPSGKTLEIPKAMLGKAPTPKHPSITAAPGGARVVLSWHAHSCGDACGGDLVTVGAHRIVLVDAATGSVQRIAEGTGVGAARFDPAGHLFVQRDRRTFQVERPDEPASWKELPAGIVLVAPVMREDAIQCCGF